MRDYRIVGRLFRANLTSRIVTSSAASSTRAEVVGASVGATVVVAGNETTGARGAPYLTTQNVDILIYVDFC